MEEQKKETAQKVTVTSSDTASAFEVKKDAGTMSAFKADKEEPSTLKVLFVLLLMAALGVGTGYAAATFTAKPGSKSAIPQALNPNAPQKGQTFGVEDTAEYKDTAEGVVKEGGIEGEGQYHLERPGGNSQNVYMTSSTVDLSNFVGKKIKVWGATQAAQTAGWLMDVGKVEVL